MTIECYRRDCAKHSVHSDPHDGPFCSGTFCTPLPLAVGVMRRDNSGIANWRVWTGKRWQKCWSAKGATLIANDLKRAADLRESIVNPVIRQSFAYGVIAMHVSSIVNIGALV